MSKAISYSLFGYNKARQINCFDFNSYLRGLMVNIRINRILYPNWVNVLNIDSNTLNSPFQPIFTWLQNKGLLEINLCPNDEALCMAMLWRLKPIFFLKDRTWEYTHVLCRDIDSVATYREAQAVKQWIDEDKTVHCITDSISHNIPMMGGMIGFRPEYFTDRLKVQAWDQLMRLSENIDYKRKGADQEFLNRYVYPKTFDSATEHFVLGMKQNIPEGDGRHYSIPDIEINVDLIYKETNSLAGHIGAAGYYEPPLVKFLNNIDPYRDEYKEIEKQYSSLFYWRS